MWATSAALERLASYYRDDPAFFNAQYGHDPQYPKGVKASQVWSVLHRAMRPARMRMDALWAGWMTGDAERIEATEPALEAINAFLEVLDGIVADPVAHDLALHERWLDTLFGVEIHAMRMVAAEKETNSGHSSGVRG